MAEEFDEFEEFEDIEIEPRTPVLIGGAAINRRFGRRALFVEGERAYAPGVFYCKDAFEGLETMDRLQDVAEVEGLDLGRDPAGAGQVRPAMNDPVGRQPDRREGMARRLCRAKKGRECGGVVWRGHGLGERMDGYDRR